ncbi:MAG: zinc ribbon domain-containing protein [Planctomycetota bacterium]|jgi:hypothetical protein
MRKLILGLLILAGSAGCRAMRTEHLYQRYPGHTVVRKRVESKPYWSTRTSVVNGQTVTRRVRSTRTVYILVLRSPQGAFVDVAVNTNVFNQVWEGQVFPMYVATPHGGVQPVHPPPQPPPQPPQPPPPAGSAFCANCGTQINPGSNFCQACGQQTR